MATHLILYTLIDVKEVKNLSKPATDEKISGAGVLSSRLLPHVLLLYYFIIITASCLHSVKLVSLRRSKKHKEQQTCLNDYQHP